MNKIILASTSPRRKELLEKASIDFIIDASSINEVMDESLPLLERLQKLAVDKALPIHQKHSEDIVIGADTIVYFNNQIIGKAKNRNEARDILTMLSSQRHTVYTAVAIYFGHNLYTFVDQTNVYFKDIMEMLDEYLLSMEWQGKAGAYGIQGKAMAFVDRIEGEKETVVGLPIKRIVEILKEKHVLN